MGCVLRLVVRRHDLPPPPPSSRATKFNMVPSSKDSHLSPPDEAASSHKNQPMRGFSEFIVDGL
jgi:hypothetical protein